MAKKKKNSRRGVEEDTDQIPQAKAGLLLSVQRSQKDAGRQSRPRPASNRHPVQQLPVAKAIVRKPIAQPSKALAPPPPPPEVVDEDAILREAYAGVRPLGGAPTGHRMPVVPEVRRTVVSEEAEVLAALSDLVSGVGNFDLTETDEYVEGARVGLDPRLLTRLRRGEFAVQDHIDLHGMIQPDAKLALQQFVIKSVGKGMRTVLVVHGRGLGSPGGRPILKHAAAQWLSHGEIGAHVHAFATAKASGWWRWRDVRPAPSRSPPRRVRCAPGRQTPRLKVHDSRSFDATSRPAVESAFSARDCRYSRRRRPHRSRAAIARRPAKLRSRIRNGPVHHAIASAVLIGRPLTLRARANSCDAAAKSPAKSRILARKICTFGIGDGLHRGYCGRQRRVAEHLVQRSGAALEECHTLPSPGDAVVMLADTDHDLIDKTEAEVARQPQRHVPVLTGCQGLVIRAHLIDAGPSNKHRRAGRTIFVNERAQHLSREMLRPTSPARLIATLGTHQLPFRPYDIDIGIRRERGNQGGQGFREKNIIGVEPRDEFATRRSSARHSERRTGRDEESRGNAPAHRRLLATSVAVESVEPSSTMMSSRS